MKHNSTIDYYNRNAARYFNETVHADVSEIRDRFAQMLPPGGTILDLGCGSGRDSKAFIEQGFRVVAVDGSEKLCKLAQAYIQQPVVCSDFLDYKPNETFDGIWACASLLHLTEAECQIVVERLSKNLKPGGCFYMSFKMGEFEGERDGRYYQDQIEKDMFKLTNIVDSLNVAYCYLSSEASRKLLWTNGFLVKVKR